MQLLAAMVTQEHLAEGRVYPPLSMIREVSTKMAVGVIDYAYKHDLAQFHPKPKDVLAHVEKKQYSMDYQSFIPSVYPWPESKSKI